MPHIRNDVYTHPDRRCCQEGEGRKTREKKRITQHESAVGFLRYRFHLQWTLIRQKGTAEGPRPTSPNSSYLIPRNDQGIGRTREFSAWFYWRPFIERRRKNASRCVEIIHRWDMDVPVGRDERFIWEIDRRGFRYFEKILRRKRWNAALL